MRLGVALASIVLLAGCGSERGDRMSDRAQDGVRDADRPGAARANVRDARCPPTAVNCESATGTVMYVEAVDPDGDGDAHFVLESDASITGPGVSVIDVRRDLRPRPLPGPGDVLSAAGPVYRGSYGQRQIQADVVHVAN